MPARCIVEKEGHTLASVLRDFLEEEDTNFFACNVAHPQDTYMNILLDCENPDQALRNALEKAIECIGTIEQNIEQQRLSDMEMV